MERRWKEEEEDRQRQAEHERLNAMWQQMEQVRIQQEEEERKRKLEEQDFERQQIRIREEEEQEEENRRRHELLVEEQFRRFEHLQDSGSTREQQQESQESYFPNRPIGGGFEGAAYVVSSDSNTHYSPLSSTNTSVINSTRGRPKKGIMGFANRVMHEAAHKIDRAYAFVSDNDTSFSLFRKYFRFQNYEPLYAEFPCKFASSQEHMMIGAMYVTPNYLCFTGELLNSRLSVILSYADIENIEDGVTTFSERYKKVPTITPASSSSSKPNALLIHDTQGKIHRLYSFNEALRVWQTIFGVWLDNPLRIERAKKSEMSKMAFSPLPPPILQNPYAPIPGVPYGSKFTSQTVYTSYQTPSQSSSTSVSTIFPGKIQHSSLSTDEFGVPSSNYHI